MAEKGFSVRLSARVDQYLAAMEKARRSTEDVSGVDFKRLGGKMQDVGSTLSTHVTLPIIAVGGLAVKMSSDFESAFARMTGLAGVTADEVDGLKESVLDLAGRTAQAPQDLADALYEASSAGLSTEDAMAAVEVAAKGAAAGMGSAKDIVGLVASAVASYGAANITAAEATDILTASIRAGRADPAELAGSLGRVLPVAAQLGISFEEVGGATAFLSNVFGDTNRTVTALSGFLIKLVSPTQQGRDALTDMGTSVAELQAAIDQDGLMGALNLLREKGFGDNQQALRALFDDIEGFQGALALLNDNSGTLTSTMEATATSAGALDEAFKGASETAGFKMKQAWADVQVALIQAGDIIIPVVAGIAGAIGNLVSKFSELPGPVQAIVIGLLGLVAAAGPVLMIGGSLVRNFNDVKKALGGMAAGATTAGIALGAVGLVVLAATAIYQDNADKKRKLREVTDQFTEALNREAEGQKGAIRESIAAQIVQKGLVATASEFGLTAADLARIVQGETVPAFEAMRREIEEDPVRFQAVTGASDATLRSFRGMTQELDLLEKGLTGAGAETKLLAQVERDLAAATTETDRETRRAKESTGEFTTAADELTTVLPLTEEELKANADATADLGKALDNSTNRFEVLAGAADLLSKALDSVFGPYQDLEEANRNLQEAAAATTQAFIDNGATLDINTEKGRSNREVVEAQAKAALDYGAVLVGQGKSTEEATNATNFLIEALKETMRQGGLSEEQIADYITTLGLTPENVTTAVNLANDEATKIRLGEIQEQLGDIDAGAAAEIRALIEEGKFAEAEARLREIAKDKNIKLNLVPGSGLRLDVRTGSAMLVGVTSEGGVFDREQIRSISEGGRREAVLPLTKPARLAQLLADPRVGGPVTAALAASVFTPASTAGQAAAPAPTSAMTQLRDVTLNNYRQELTVDEFSRVLAMARLAA